MNIFVFRYYDQFGFKREKEIVEADYQSAVKRFNKIIKDADVYEVVL